MAVTVDKPLGDKIIIITGASKGFGKAMSLRLAEEDVNLGLVARDEEALAETGRQAERLGSKIQTVAVDVSVPYQVSTMSHAIKHTLGIPDIIINNAGEAGDQGLIADISYGSWHRTIKTNLDSMFLVCREFVPEMIEKRTGAIINVTSGAGKRRDFLDSRAPRSLPYAVSKFGVEGFTQGLAAQLFPYGIAVNAFSPGPMNTDFHQYSPADRRKGLKDPAQAAEAIAFLCAQTCNTMTGSTFTFEEWCALRSKRDGE